MTPIAAKLDITTDKGFVVAKQGDAGVALRGIPNKPEHGGRILVFFDRRNRSYWVDPGALLFTDVTASAVQYSSRLGKSKALDAHKLCLPAYEARVYNFGSNLKKVRHARNVSQSALGNAMGRYGLLQAQSTICHWELRSYCPNGKFVDAAAKALNCPPWIFFVDLSDHRTSEDVRTYISTLFK